MWPLFKEAKTAGKHAYWRVAKLFVNAFLYLGAWGPKRPMRGIMEHARGVCK
jgi:hypothetical protein